MKVTEEPKKIGVTFNIKGTTTEELNEISRWCQQNKIQYLGDYGPEKYRYFIVNEESIMAFKLRWL